MKLAKCTLHSISPYGQSKYVGDIPKKDRESSADYEERTWKNRLHTNMDGQIFIPPMAFANSLKEAAKYLSIQIPGKGKATYTKNFESGVMVTDPLVLPLTTDDVIKTTLHVPSDGRPGGSKRVIKNFPQIREWSGVVDYYILDEIITQPVFEQVLKTSGFLIGIGFFRPRNRGYWGRFESDSVEWIEDAVI